MPDRCNGQTPLALGAISVPARHGRPPSWPSSAEAGGLKAQDLVLVTNNTRKFGRVAGLKTVDWLAG